jgi:hypothetical protein
LEIAMRFKTILVPIEQHDLMNSTLETALLLARSFDSYIVPCDQNDPGSHLSKRFRGNLANSRRATCDDNCFAIHARAPDHFGRTH